MSKIQLESGKLYIMSGPQGVGKSTFLKSIRLSEELIASNVALDLDKMVVSSDRIQEQLLGYDQKLMPDGVIFTPNAEMAQTAEKMAKLQMEYRLSQRMTTFVDMACLKDSTREWAVGLAREYSMPYEILICTAEADQIRSRCANRARKVPESLVEESLKRFEPTSKHPHRVIDLSGDFPEVELVLSKEVRLEVDKPYDFIGDVHSMFDGLRSLVAKLGYVEDAKGVPHHPDGRTLVFLGDIIDRGLQPKETLNYVMEACAAGHKYIRGNHEAKVLRMLKNALKGSFREERSQAATQTGYTLLKEPKAWVQSVVEFIERSPHWLYCPTKQGVLVQHADCNTKLDLFSWGLSNALYGKGIDDEGLDTDAMWDLCNPPTYLIRGHIRSTYLGVESGVERRVAAVYEKGEFGGNLVALRVDSLLSYTLRGTCEWIRESSQFNYDLWRAQQPKYLEELKSLVSKRKVYKVLDVSQGLTLYTYDASVHYNREWLFGEKLPSFTSSVLGTMLSESRGLILDTEGKVVCRPLYKVLNAGEYGLALSKDAKGFATPNFNGQWDLSAEVIEVEKLNGYAAFVSAHPNRRNELLFSGTGSMGDSAPYPKMVKEWMQRTKSYGAYLKMLQKYSEYTFGFEMVHPEDPHICEYTAEQQGLYLIMMRHKETGQLKSEAELDAIWQEMGCIGHRPSWRVTTLQESYDSLCAKVNVEGYMYRHPETGVVLMKRKSMWYLTTKFFGRMVDGQIKYLFAKPQDFKQKVDEEYYQLIDLLVSRCTVSEFLAKSQQERLALVRELLKSYV